MRKDIWDSAVEWKGESLWLKSPATKEILKSRVRERDPLITIVVTSIVSRIRA